ncbi:hypothetical protein BGX30_011676 [Mortierella sp. GBA39]|nr:hypothetical protein BGX30_011676 [Mortierella sp. GBA39]
MILDRAAAASASPAEANRSPLAPLIDAHIHLDTYKEHETQTLLGSLKDAGVEAVIGVSMDLASSQANLRLAQTWPGQVYPAFGFHPEQPLPADREIDALFGWMAEHADDMVAVGEDADIACDLLEKYGVSRAHFHWFKGSADTVRRMADSGYYVSFTPDIANEAEIQELARRYPASQVMTETDGPWPFEGPFAGQMTHPRMTAEVALVWSSIRGVPLPEARALLHANACRFYGLQFHLSSGVIRQRAPLRFQAASLSLKARSEIPFQQFLRFQRLGPVHHAQR